MKRQIRLREFEANQTIYRSPSLRYASNARGLTNDISYTAKTDENGYIVSGRYFHCSKKICVIGASLIENIFVKESIRWNTLVEKLFLENGDAYKFYNAGYSGATSLNILNTLLNKVYNDNFDLIIYFISSNDWSATSYDRSYWNLTKNHSNLFLSEYIEEDRNYKNISESHFDSLIKSTYCTASCFNQNFWLATYPNLCDNRALVFLNNRLRKICKENNFKLLDIDYIMQSNELSFDENFYDRLHFNEKGSVAFSKSLYDFVSFNYLTKENKSILTTKKLLNKQVKASKNNKLSFNDTFYTNKIFQEVSFNLIINIEDKISKSENDLIVRIIFEENADNKFLTCKGLKHTDKLGWHFYLDVPNNKKIETSYAFVSNFSGNVVLEIECLNEDSQLTINSIEIEILKN